MKRNTMRNNTKQAFTLAETLIVLVIVSFLATFLLQVIRNAAPDRDLSLFKKAYSVAERTVAELVNDETLYPYDTERPGFLNTDCAIIQSAKLLIGENCNPLTGYEIRTHKFCELFKTKVNIIEDDPEQLGFHAGDCAFQTSDTIIWNIVGEFNCDLVQATLGSQRVNICNESTLDNEIEFQIDTNAGDSTNPLRTFKARSDGKMIVEGEEEIRMLRATKLNGEE